LLFYAPQVLGADTPELRRANMPLGWARPAFDVLQLEDYTFVTSDNEAGLERGRTEVEARLGYPAGEQHYLAGFVADAGQADSDWPRIAAALDRARERTVAERLVWAWPQIARDGFVWFDLGMEGASRMSGETFQDVLFPLDVGLGAAGGPEFQTQIATLDSGFEQRNLQWQSARLRYDAGIGVRSEADLAALLSFFRARRGQALGFRFRDPMDHSSSADGLSAPDATDQHLGQGDGMRLRFGLRKTYGGAQGEERLITRPVAGSVRVAVAGVEQLSGWSIEAMGVVRFDEAPPPGAEVTAGFSFDVPVRFATDRLDITLAGWRAGEVPNVPIVELREARA
jgi:uncharacterized protein (TIGR02217 family)